MRAPDPIANSGKTILPARQKIKAVINYRGVLKHLLHLARAQLQRPHGTNHQILAPSVQ